MAKDQLEGMEQFSPKALVWCCAVAAGVAAFIAVAADNGKTETCIVYAVEAALGVFVIGGAHAALTISDTLKDIKRIMLKEKEQSSG